MVLLYNQVGMGEGGSLKFGGFVNFVLIFEKLFYIFGASKFEI